MIPTSTPFIIDIEASGFGSSSYPIEVGVALENGNRFCSLIVPAPSWQHWDKEAEKVHHISQELLNESGKPILEVADFLNKSLAGLTLYSDGWVVDKPWLTTLFYEAQRPMKFNVSPLETILSEEQMILWKETKVQVIADLNLSRHRASNDAWIIQETFKRTLRMKNAI